MKLFSHLSGPRTALPSVLRGIFLTLILVGGQTAHGMTKTEPHTFELPNCQYSESVFQSDVSLMGRKPPTHFNLMTSRFREVVQAARGRTCTGSATIAFDGHKYFQAGLGDDPGIAELIPSIASWTGLSLPSSFDFTELVVISLAILIGYVGYWRLCTRARWMGLAVFLGIGLLEAKVADVYIFQLSPLLAGIPWVIYFAVVDNAFGVGMSAALLVFFSSWCSLLRSGTMLMSVTFTITLILGRFPIRKAGLIVLVVLLSGLPSLVFVHKLIAQRDLVLATLGEMPTGVNSHPIWHSIYLGLGFVPNSEVSAFRDGLAAERVRSIDPSVAYTSEKYEAILRREVVRIARHNPLAVLENVAVKFGIVILLAFVIMYPSRKCALTGRKDFWLDIAFSLTIAVSASSAVLVAPLPPYLLTFVCLTGLFSCVSYCRTNQTETACKRP